MLAKDELGEGTCRLNPIEDDECGRACTSPRGNDMRPEILGHQKAFR